MGEKGKKSSGFIDKYLDRFSESINKIRSEKYGIIQIIKEETRAEIGREEFEVKDGVLFLKVRPIIKSEIVMKKERLLKRLEKEKIFDIK
jgi:hypothetical protein